MGDSGNYGDDHGDDHGGGGGGGGGGSGGGSDRLETKEARHTDVSLLLRGGDAQEVNAGRGVAPPLIAGPMRGALQRAMSEEDCDGTHQGAVRGGVARLEQRLEEEIRQRVAGEVRDSQCCTSYEIAVLGGRICTHVRVLHARVCVVAASAHGCTRYDVLLTIMRITCILRLTPTTLAAPLRCLSTVAPPPRPRPLCHPRCRTNGSLTISGSNLRRRSGRWSK